MIPNDTFSYQKQNKLFPDTISLSQCYQPIIGIPAFALYHFLIAHFDGGVGRYRFSDLLNHLDFGQQQLEKSLDLLMGMQLLSLYKEKDHYLLVLQPPLSIQSFLKNALYRSLLSNKIGEYAVEHLLASLSTDAANQTKSFSEVFGMDGRPHHSVSRGSQFDSHAFAEMMKRHQLQFSNESEDWIALHHLAETNNKNWLDLYHVAQETAIGHRISVKRMRERLQSEQQKQETTEFSPAEEALIRESKSMTALDFLQAVKANKKAAVLPSEKRCIQELANLGLLDETINVIVLYTLNKMNSANLNETYALKLGNDFSYHEIRTAQAAVKRLRADKPVVSRQKTKTTSSNVPSWSNPTYKDETSAEDLKELERIQQEILANLEKGD